MASRILVHLEREFKKLKLELAREYSSTDCSCDNDDDDNDEGWCPHASVLTTEAENRINSIDTAIQQLKKQDAKKEI